MAIGIRPAYISEATDAVLVYSVEATLKKERRFGNARTGTIARGGGKESGRQYGRRNSSKTKPENALVRRNRSITCRRSAHFGYESDELKKISKRVKNWCVLEKMLKSAEKWMAISYTMNARLKGENAEVFTAFG